jgi:membrane fusion protein (multidrug efflux system)
MLMTVELRRDRRRMPAIPGGAVVRLDTQAYVFVLEEGERGLSVSRRQVELGRRTQGMIEVISGIEVGEQIVSEGVHRLSDGAAVTIPAAASTGGSRERSAGAMSAAD